MSNRRIVVGSIGAGDELVATARALRDLGNEVVLVGGGQSAEQLICAALAEDASELVAGAGDLAQLESLRQELDAEDILLTAAVTESGVTDPTHANTS